MFGIQKVAVFEGVSVYETSLLGYGYGSAGLCLPGIGIFVGKGTFDADLEVVQHEYGHVLQAQSVGFLSFYMIIGLMSLMSASTNGFSRGHQHYWAESWCNHLAKNYFIDHCQVIWNERRFPSKNISHRTLRWIRWKL